MHRRDRGVLLLALVGVLAAALVGLSFVSGSPREPETNAVVEYEQAKPARVGAGAGAGPAAGPGSAGLGSPGQIHGRIIDSSTGPLSEGRVALHCLDGALLTVVPVEEDGGFQASACASGPTCVRLIHPGVEQPRAWEVEAGAAIELEAQPAPIVSGVVVGFDGAVVPGAELLVQRGATQAAIGTDAAGEFALALPQLRPCDRCDSKDDPESAPSCRGSDAEQQRSSATVLGSAPGYAPAQIEVEPDALDPDAPVQLVLPAAAPAISGIVRGRDGTAFDARTRVIATNLEREHEQHAALVDDQGRFRFSGLAAAEYSLRAIRDAREIAALALARPGEQVELRSDLSAQGSALTVEIVDSAGDPVVGARVDGGPLRAAISDAEGRVQAITVLPGIYPLRVRTSECAVVRETLELEANAGSWVRIVRVPANC